MSLEMRAGCERCGVELPPNAQNALICSYECTFCSLCADEIGFICPNDGGELLKRPRRATY
jgi:uncharacterized protein